MDQNLRASIQSSTFYYFMIVMTLTTISQLTTMSVIVFADIAGKENVVAASVIGPALLGAFGIIRLLTNMTHIVADMDKDMKATKYGATVSGIPSLSSSKSVMSGIPSPSLSAQSLITKSNVEVSAH